MIKKPTPWLWLGVLAAGVLLLVAWLHQRYPDTLGSRDGQVGLVQGLLILVLVASSLLVRGRPRFGRLIRDAASWVAICGLILIGYSFRHDIVWLGNRLVGTIDPSSGISASNAIVFPASANGHFYVSARVDNKPIRFLVDTGASSVVLSPRDAQRLGFDPAKMNFSQLYQTANGVVEGAPVLLGSIAVGPILVKNVRASVNRADLDHSLLGMSFLKRLGGYEVRDDALTLWR